jgi:hypothetical protein
MILRRYGHNIHSVSPNFDSRAMTEVGFTRSGELTIPTNEFADLYERADGRELTATAEGDVQGEVEDRVLADLQRQLIDLDEQAGDGAVLLIENEHGKDLAKTRSSQTTRVVQNANRLYFQFSIDPPLRVGIYRRKGA